MRLVSYTVFSMRISEAVGRVDQYPDEITDALCIRHESQQILLGGKNIILRT